MVGAVNNICWFAAIMLAGLIGHAPIAFGQSEVAGQSGSPALSAVSETAPARAAPGKPHVINLNDTADVKILPDSDDTSVMLTDGSFENGEPERQATMLIVSSDSESDAGIPEDVELFAAVMFYMTDDLFDKIKIKDSATLKIAGLQAAETTGKAKGIQTGEKIKLVQWMMFSTEGRFIRLIGYAPKDEFDAALPRFEKVRDGLEIGG